MRRWRSKTSRGLAAFALCAVFLWARGAAPPSQAQAAVGYRIIVNPANPITFVDRKFLSDVFLKKITRWDSGEVVKPVDQRPDAQIREQFSAEVLRRSVSAAKSYWQQLVFSGRDVPPPEVDTDEQVIRYVQRYQGGVGYVSGGTSLELVKAIAIK